MGREAPPTSASAPSPPPLAPPLGREKGGDVEPSPGKVWGGSLARTPPPGRPALLAPRGGSFQEELRARRTAGRTDTLSSSSARPESGAPLELPGPDRVGTLRK